MKALVKKSPEHGIWMEDVPEPQCGTNDVKIKVTHTGICGTDLHIYTWNEWAQRTLDLPLITGHEFCGIVEEIGPGITHKLPIDDFQEGFDIMESGNCGKVVLEW